MDQIAREELILSNQGLVYFIARKYNVPGLPLNDLVQEGNIGLMRAAENFDPGKGKFGTYAFWWVKAYILRAIKRNWLVHIPSRRHDAKGHDEQDAPFCWMVELEESATVPSEGGELDPFEAVSRNETKQGIQRMLSELEPRERRVICLRFGIGYCGKEHTLEEIARSVGLSREGVRQVIDRALVKMRERNAALRTHSPVGTGKAEFHVCV